MGIFPFILIPLGENNSRWNRIFPHTINALMREEIKMLSQLDIEWAEMVAGRPLDREEIVQLKNDYEDWIQSMEENPPEIYRDVDFWE